jgi:hypothetical protein
LICQVVIPILIENLAPFLGPIGTLAEDVLVPILSAATGLDSSTVSQAVVAANGPTDAATIAAMEKLLTLQGVLTNIPQLITLVADLGGLATHGSYDAPHDEFGGRTGIQVACDVMASFRR